jgi:hypothetical protein
VVGAGWLRLPSVMGELIADMRVVEKHAAVRFSGNALTSAKR